MARKPSESALQIAVLSLKESFPSLTPEQLKAALQAQAKAAGQPPEAGPDRLLKPDEAAKLLSVSRRTLFTWAKAGRIHPVNLAPGHIRAKDQRIIGGRRAYRLSEISAIVAGGIPA